MLSCWLAIFFMTRDDLNRASRLQQGGILELQLAETEIGRHGTDVLELKVGVNARSLHHMKGSGELVLMDVGRPIHPEEDLDVELGIVIDD